MSSGTGEAVGDALDRIDPEPNTLARFHFVMMIAWAALALPTVLLWRESILWVAFMSLYANFVGHFSGWDAARAEKNAAESS
jgi:hypothetical protein